MSRPIYPFYSSNISELARSLKQQWAEAPDAPSHLQILNMLAKAAGFANFQHLRASCETVKQQEAQEAAVVPAVKRLLRHFDEQGRLLRWPNKFSEQQICLWAAWDVLPPAGEYSEAQINQPLKQCQTFNDHVMLRRELVSMKLLDRTPDGRKYWRLPGTPDADTASLLAVLRGRRARAG
ncbi:DUF2087 domain-containing protein [Silvimonas sp. JCM 19000]